MSQEIPKMQPIHRPLWKYIVQNCVEAGDDLAFTISAVRRGDDMHIVEESDIRAYWNELRKPKPPPNNRIVS